MPAKLLTGKLLAEKTFHQIKNKVATMKIKPGLAVILVGDNPASQLYLRIKKEACEKVGINFHTYLLDNDAKEEKVIEVINFLNNDPEITGILVQLPLPKGFNTDKIIQAIDPAKDVDGFHPRSKFTSPNVLGIIELIKSTSIDLKNKRIAVLSNSELFAQPFKKLLPQSQVDWLDQTTLNSKLKPKSQKADVLIVALGKPYYIKPNVIKKDAILIDVGISKINGKTIGDIDPKCDQIASWRSPVPGGVGPMTVAMLLHNLVK